VLVAYGPSLALELELDMYTNADSTLRSFMTLTPGSAHYEVLPYTHVYQV